jgi:hypothetical protein
MPDVNLRYNYHDAHVSGFKIGPRREFTLTVHLDPFLNKEIAGAIRLSFRGIHNLDTISAFVTLHLKPRQKPNAFIVRIDAIEKTDKNTYRITFDHIGQLEIRGKGHTETIPEAS